MTVPPASTNPDASPQRRTPSNLAPDRDLVLEAAVVFIGRRGSLDIKVEADRGAVAERRRVDHVVGVDGDPERLQADRPLLDRCLAHEVRPDAGCSELERVRNQRQFVVEDDDGILTLFVGEKPGRAGAGAGGNRAEPATACRLSTHSMSIVSSRCSWGSPGSKRSVSITRTPREAQQRWFRQAGRVHHVRWREHNAHDEHQEKGSAKAPNATGPP